jgi:hypothetical protein
MSLTTSFEKGLPREHDSEQDSTVRRHLPQVRPRLRAAARGDRGRDLASLLPGLLPARATQRRESGIAERRRIDEQERTMVIAATPMPSAADDQEMRVMLGECPMCGQRETIGSERHIYGYCRVHRLYWRIFRMTPADHDHFTMTPMEKPDSWKRTERELAAGIQIQKATMGGELIVVTT